MPVEAPHTLRSIEQLLGIPRRVIARLIQAGFVQPSRGPRNEYRFSFQDVVLLRTAHSLQSANIPPRRILRSLQRLKATLPAQLPLTGLRITAIGNEIAVHEGHTRWEPESGQLLMDFELAPSGTEVVVLAREPDARSPTDLLADAQALAEHSPERAEAVFRAALKLAPDLADAYLDLGVLLCDQGRGEEAVRLYDEAVSRCPGEALLYFNRAVALEDAGRLADALCSYESCLALDPNLADAHFNAARIHEQLGHAQKALQHFNAYRRLER